MARSGKLRNAGRAVLKTEARATRRAEPRGGVGQKIVGTIGKGGDQPELRTLSAFVIAGGLLRSDRRLLRTGVRMLLAHEIATLAKNLVKEQFDRTRPHSASSRRERAVKPGKHTAKSMTSFPSGHSAGSTAVARAVARDYPQAQAPGLGAAAVVSLMQVPRLNHYPTDVAAGMLLGAVSEALAGAAVPKLDEDIRREEPLPPPLPA
jgi:membrane-associated phospholipid phosphatase